MDAGIILRLRRNEDGRLEGVGWGEGVVEDEGVQFRAVGEPIPCAKAL